MASNSLENILSYISGRTGEVSTSLRPELESIQSKANYAQIKKLTGAQAMVRMLEAHNVDYMFGLCGDTSLPFYHALATMDHGIQHIHMRDERHAAYAADAYARLTNRVGVCEGPSGGGATYLLPAWWKRMNRRLRLLPSPPMWRPRHAIITR